MHKCLLYGASGYTGRLLARAARARGLRPILAGRDASKLAALAQELSLECRAFGLEDPTRLAAGLADVRVVLNAAGPFRLTARPLIEACVQAGIHYLDLSGEVSTLEATAQLGARARGRGLMLMPAVGFDVVPSDCLAVYVAGRVPDPVRLAIGVSGLALVSRGSAKTIAGLLDEPVWVRRGGELRGVAHGSLARRFDFGAGPRLSLAAAWGDVVGAYYSTGVPDITVYFEATPALRAHETLLGAFRWALPWTPWQGWVAGMSEVLSDGPSDAERAQSQLTLVAEAENALGARASARLRTPEAYTLSAETGAEILARVAAGDLEPGFQTPARLFGADFILGFAGVHREDA